MRPVSFLAYFANIMYNFQPLSTPVDNWLRLELCTQSWLGDLKRQTTLRRQVGLLHFLALHFCSPFNSVHKQGRIDLKFSEKVYPIVLNIFDRPKILHKPYLRRYSNASKKFCWKSVTLCYTLTFLLFPTFTTPTNKVGLSWNFHGMCIKWFWTYLIGQKFYKNLIFAVIRTQVKSFAEKV